VGFGATEIAGSFTGQVRPVHERGHWEDVVDLGRWPIPVEEDE
jgi:hypothetical protein